MIKTKSPRKFLGLPWRYWILTLLISAAILFVRFGVRTPGRFAADAGAVGTYLGTIGTLYGILAAFTIFVVWTQFNDTHKATDSEANELSDLFRYSIYLGDPTTLNALSQAIKAYCASIIRDEWPAMSRRQPSPATAEDFEAIFRAVNAVRFDDTRDAFAWEKMIAKLESASDARTDRLSLAEASVPRLLRVLLYVVSLALLLGFFFLSISSDLIAILVTVATTSIVLLAIEVVEDLDNPFGGQWSLSPATFTELGAHIDALRAEAEALDGAGQPRGAGAPASA
jgi:hypothetical protein